MFYFIAYVLKPWRLRIVSYLVIRKKLCKVLVVELFSICNYRVDFQILLSIHDDYKLIHYLNILIYISIWIT